VTQALIQECLLEEAGLSSGDLSEAEWRLLEPLLPPEQGRKSRSAFDNRQIVNGIASCGASAPRAVARSAGDVR
jgi:transposase